MGKAISCSDCARQTPELLGPGKGTKRRPNQICASEGYLRAKLEWLRPGRCMQPRVASDGSRRSNLEPEQFVRREQGQAQRGWDTACTHQCYLFAASLPPHRATEQVSLKKKKWVSTTAPLVSGWKSDTEETSKQKKLNRGNCLGSDPTLPTTPEKVPDISLLFFSILLSLSLFLLMLFVFSSSF